MNYKIALRTLKHRKIQFTTLAFFILVNLPLNLILLMNSTSQSGFDPSTVPLVIGGSILLIGEFWLLGQMYLRNLSHNALELQANYLVRTNGYKKEILYFKDIKQIKIVHLGQNPQNALIKIQAPFKRINLIGYEDMTQIILAFEKSPLTLSRIHSTRHRWNWHHPLTTIVACLLLTPIVVWSLLDGLSFYYFISPFVQLLLGLYLFHFKPLSRNIHDKFYHLERLLGALVSLISFVNLFFI